jgi:hypothetical protein
MDFTLCRTLDFLASWINVFLFVQRLENPKIWTQQIYTI